MQMELRLCFLNGKPRLVWCNANDCDPLKKWKFKFDQKTNSERIMKTKWLERQKTVPDEDTGLLLLKTEANLMDLDDEWTSRRINSKLLSV